MQTVADLMARLALLPQDLPIHRQGKVLGELPPGCEVRVTRLMKSERETTFVADLNDRVWFKTGRKGFEEPFEAVVIG